MRLPVLAAALGAASLSSGCTVMAGAAIASAGVVTMQDRTMGRAIDDISASSTIKTRLLALDSTGYLRVGVKSVGGQVLLAGTVPSAEHKAMAEHIAWSVAGVSDVADELQIGRPHGIMRTSMDNLLSTEVRTRLVADKAIKGVNYNVETEEGVVYLMGVARSEEELQRAADIVSRTGGVKRVVSYVVVRARNPMEPVLAEAPPPIEHRAAAEPPKAAKTAANAGADDFATDDGPYGAEGTGAPVVAQGQN